MHHIHTVY